MVFLAGPPSNLTYKFSTTCNKTHLPIILSWLLPHSDAEELVLSYTHTSAAVNEEPGVMILAYNSSNATMPLQYNKTYDVILYATSCGGSVNSDSTSINLTLPEYDGMCQYGRSKICNPIKLLTIGFRLLKFTAYSACGELGSSPCV